MRLKDKVAVITGSGTGLGRATALAFAREGARVVLSGRREEPLREAAEAIAAAGGRAVWQTTDVRRAEEVRRLMDRAVEEFGRLDIVMANAGVNPSRTNILETSEADWRLTLDINLTGVFLTCKYGLPRLIENGGGVILVTSSVIGLKGAKNRIPYGATKGGVNQMVRCLAVDHAKDNIRAVALCPGRILTDLVKHLQNEGGDWAEVSRSYPLGIKGTEEDFARAAVYLASDEASWVTGVLFPVDGGYSA